MEKYKYSTLKQATIFSFSIYFLRVIHKYRLV